MTKPIIDRYEYLSQVRVPFGKFKGYELAQIPLSYLNWMATESLTDVALQMDVQEYLKLAKVQQDITRRAYEKQTDIKPIPRGWRR